MIVESVRANLHVDYFVGIDGVNDKSTPVSRNELLSAIRGDDIELLKELLDHDVIDVVPGGSGLGGETPLSCAILHMNFEACRLLISNGKINVNEMRGGSRPIYQAFELLELYGPDIANLFLSRDDVDLGIFHQSSNESPFTMALDEIVRLDHIIGKNSNNVDALWRRRCAVESLLVNLVGHNNFNINDVLFDAAKFDPIKNSNLTLLTYFAGLTNYQNVFDALVRRSGVAINFPDGNGDFPIEIAAFNYHSASVASLLTHPDFNHYLEGKGGNGLLSVFMEVVNGAEPVVMIFNAMADGGGGCRALLEQYGRDGLVSYIQSNINIFCTFDLIRKYLSIRGAAGENGFDDALKLKVGALRVNEATVVSFLESVIDGVLLEELEPIDLSYQ